MQKKPWVSAGKGVSGQNYPYCTDAFSINPISNEDYLWVVISIVLKNNEKKITPSGRDVTVTS